MHHSYYFEQGARSFTQTESEGQTPLHIAALYGSYETARVLIEDGSYMYISKITIMWNLNDVNMIYILFCFCASGNANVNATDKNGNNALHLCLMRRPAMMEFAKVSNTLAVTVKSVIQIYFTQTLCSWIWNACQILFSKWFWVHFLRLFWALFYFRMF